MVRNTYIYPPAPSMRIISDIFSYTAEQMPRFNSISISGYHMQEAGATADLELAYTLADGVEYLRAGLDAGLDIDRFAPRLSFFWAIGMNFFMEVAKMRAARALWARLVSEFDPQNPKSLSLRTHCQTSGWSLTAQDVFNNVGRTCIEAMAATQGHTQSLHTNALDEAIALPTDFSARIARNTQLLLQQETGTTGTIDPWGGSLLRRAAHPRPRRAGLGAHPARPRRPAAWPRPSSRASPRCASRRPPPAPRPASTPGAQTVIGVNTYRLAAEDPLDVLKVDNDDVYRQQIAKLERLRAERDDDEVRRALDGADRLGRARPAGARRQPARARRRRGPRQGHGRRDLRRAGEGLRPAPRRDPYDLRRVQGRVGLPAERRPRAAGRSTRPRSSSEAEGRRPRILVAKMGQDGHDRGQKVVVTAFADMGFDVDVGPLFSTPEEVAQQAVDADVHIVGVSSLAAGHLDPAARLEAGAGRARPPRHHGRDRRRDPARRRPRAPGDGRRRGLPARHRDRRVGARPAGQAAAAARMPDA